MLFEKLMDCSLKIDEVKPSNVNLYESPLFNTNVLREKMNTINNINDKDLYNLIKESYKFILKDILLRDDTEYLEVFTTPKFITTLTQVLNSVKLEYNEKITCNKLAYDYFTLNGNDPYVKELLFILSKMVNKDKIPEVLSLGIPDNLATYMVLARYSSQKEDINVKRLNFIISTQSPRVMSPQMIVKIYEKLFDRIGVLILTTMFDIYDEDEEWVTEDIMETYANISYAILVILNNMPSEAIRTLLVNFTDDCEMLHNADHHSLRFSMQSISQDFSRIVAIVEILKEQGIYVP